MVIDPQGKALTRMVFEATKDKMATAAVTEDGRGVLMVMSGEENFLRRNRVEQPDLHHSVPCRHVDQMLLTPNLRLLFVREGNRLSVYDIHNLRRHLPCAMSWRSTPQCQRDPGGPALRCVLLLVGNDNGVISQWFEVAKDGKRQFTQIRDFKVTRRSPC